ncbi:MAG: site-specific integrase [Stenotrophomonas sp.]|nr:site-specific integrase [Stenotrophomonas sp.]
MPSPLLLARPSGPYVRFLVPLDLRPAVGSRFIVRPLGVPHGDAARLVAACMAVALSHAFDALRRGQTVDWKKALEAAQAAGRKDLILEGLTFSDGTKIDRARLDTAEDVAMLSALAEQRRAQVSASSARIAAAAGRRLRLSMAIAAHLGDLEGARLHAKTILESRHTLRLFSEVVGASTPVAELTQEHVRAFFAAVRWWPSNASKRPEYRDLPVLEVFELAKKNGEPAPAAWTIAKHRQRLSVFFVSLVASGDLATNPLAGVRAIATPDNEDRGAPFSDDELRAIFGPAFVPWASKYPHRWFGPMLGLFSGARVNEVAQLRVDDVETVDGVPGFYIRAAAKGQSVKNKNSRRFVPLAQPVVAAGFLTYVDEVRASGHAQLFPNLPNSTGLGFGRQLSRQFSAYIKGLGIEEKGQGFHGFRHTLADRLDAAGASAAAIGALTGHAAGQTVLEKHYIHRSTLPDRVATLAKFSPPVTLPAYTPGQFADALKRAGMEAKREARKSKESKTPA